MSKTKYIKKWIGIIAILLVFAWMMVMYYEYSAVVPLMMTVLVLGINTAVFMISGRRMQVSIDIQERVVGARGFRMITKLSKPGWYPYKRMWIAVEVNQNYGRQINKYEFSVPVDKHTRALTISREEYGVMQVSIPKIVVEDAFGILCHKIRKKMLNQESLVLPEVSDIYVDIDPVPYVEVEESNQFSEHFSGNDSSEIFGVRQFEPGDRMNQIHWKLSARTDETMIREFSRPIETNVYMFADFEKQRDWNEEIENLLSYSEAMLKEEIPFFIFYIENESKCIKRHQPKDLEDVYEVIKRILKDGQYEEDLETEERKKQFYSENHLIIPNQMDEVVSLHQFE